MLFRTPNSSFILDLRLRSIRLWAVFLAIFLPAALVEEGCFLFVPATAGGGAACVLLLEEEEVAAEEAFELERTSWGDSSRGCICIILRDLVGGGGRANWSLSLDGPWTADERRRDLTVSLGCIYVVEPGAPSGELAVLELSLESMAGGGSSNVICRDASLEPSCPCMSVDDPGVGGSLARGISTSSLGSRVVLCNEWGGGVWVGRRAG